MSEDVLFLDSLSLQYPRLSTAAWPSPSTLPQPLLVHAELHPPDPAGFASAAETDSLDGSTLSYAAVAQAFVDHLAQNLKYTSAEQVAEALAAVALDGCGASKVALRLELPRSLLNAGSVSVCIARPSTDRLEDRFVVEDLRVGCVIGVLPHEREETQTVRIDLTCWPERGADMGMRRLVKAVTDSVAASRFQTVEALASSIAGTGLASPTIRRISVRVSKPSALPNAAEAGCRITRGRLSDDRLEGRLRAVGAGRDGFPATFSTSAGPSSSSRPSSDAPPGLHTVYLALGSNLGSRLANLDRALRELAEPVEAGGAAAIIQEVSFAYETEPMFVDDDHPDYLNAACKINQLHTPMEPLALLDAVKRVESRMGRRQTEHKTPRPIDLDILYFDDRIVDEARLRIPHAGIAKREFVLRPLLDIAPDLVHPSLRKTTAELLAHVASPPSTPPRPLPVRRASFLRSVALPSGEATAELDLSRRTAIMAIINTTPDSFSDGGDALSAPDAVSLGLRHLDSGADILDVGGVSTRPGADEVAVEEEIRRVVPVIRGLRERGVKAHISVDTFRAEVARRALEAGATMVNDVTGGVGDEGMLGAVAELGVPYVVMHSRGDPRSMAGMAAYEDGDVVDGVRRELEAMVGRALAKGVKRWDVVVDPGVGFAKDARGNLDLLRGLEGIRTGRLEGYPVLVGASRKGFLGALVGKQPKERDVATAATTVAAVQAGAAIVRVHDVAMTKDVVAVADAIYRARS